MTNPFEADPRFEIRGSTLPNAGRGLFARVALAKGEMLHAAGVLMEPGSVADECTRYADAYKFRVGDLLLLPTGYTGLANHSDTPNAEKAVLDGRLVLRMMRDIACGEEIFFRYSDYAQERFLRPVV